MTGVNVEHNLYMYVLLNKRHEEYKVRFNGPWGTVKHNVGECVW